LSPAEPKKARQHPRFPGVRAPRPLLPPETERRLTARQRQVLDELETLLADEALAALTMAGIAARLNCSLRTLYEIAPSKDELVLTVVDRRLNRIGRTAIAALDVSMSPLQALRAYLRAAHEAVQPTTASFAPAFAGVPGAKRLLDAHQGYVEAVTQSLLDRGWRRPRSARPIRRQWPTSSAGSAASSRGPRWPRSPPLLRRLRPTRSPT